MLDKRVSYSRVKSGAEEIGFTVIYKTEPNSQTILKITHGDGEHLTLALDFEDVAALAEMTSEARYATVDHPTF